jgi:hypothetical protein
VRRTTAHRRPVALARNLNGVVTAGSKLMADKIAAAAMNSV